MNQNQPHYTNLPERSFFSVMGKRITWELYPDQKVYSNIPDMKLLNNSISTTKYSFFTFLPRNLFEQFSKLPNIYFLLIGLLQIIREISTSNGIPVIFMPLAFILFITALKDIAEDFKRYRSDYDENNRDVLILRDTSLILLFIFFLLFFKSK